MKLISVRYFIKEGFKNVWLNGIMSVASIFVMVCCMLLTGTAVLISMNISSTLKSIEGKNSITVYLHSDVDSSQALEVGDKIRGIANITACEYYPREEAVKKYQEMLGSLFEVLQSENNPLPDVFHITMGDLSLYESTVREIKNFEEVDTVGDRSDTARKLTDLNNLVTKAGLWIVVSLGAISLFIISNTIKLTMYSRRFEINIMKSIGATNLFIRMPFMVEGITIGVISSVFSIALLKIVYEQIILIINKIIPFHSVKFESLLFPIFVGFLLSGMVFGLIGGVISIGRYLKREGGEIAI